MFLISLVINVLSALKANSLKFMSMINQKCMSRPKFINLNSDEPVFYPLSVSINKCSGIVIVLMTLMLNCVFLILLKILILKFLI